MAVVRPPLTFSQIEGELGYTVSCSSDLDDGINKFYANLKPVARCRNKRARRELEENRRIKGRRNGTIPESDHLELGMSRVSSPQYVSTWSTLRRLT